MPKRNRLGDDDGGDFEIPDLDIPIPGEAVKEGLKNPKTRGWTIAFIVIVVIVFLVIASGRDQQTSPTQSRPYTSSPNRTTEYSPPATPPTNSSVQYQRIGTVYRVIDDVSYLLVRLDGPSTSNSLRDGQVVYFAHGRISGGQPLSGTIEVINNDTISVLSSQGIRRYKKGMIAWLRR